MMYPDALWRRDEIDAAIERVKEIVGPDVVRIRYEIGQDWKEEWSIFFRVVITDDAAKERFRETMFGIRRTLPHELDFDQMGVHWYTNFRTESDQAALQEPAWA